MFENQNVLDLSFSLTKVHISSILSSVSEMIFSISFILLLKLASGVSAQVSKFFISRFPQLGFSFFNTLSYFELFYSFPSSVCDTIDYLRGLFISSVGISVIHIKVFKAFILCITYTVVSNACCGRVAGM